MELLFMEPVFKDMLWGGTKLHDEFGFSIPSDTTGECWSVSAHPNGDCKIAGGTYDGYFLSQLWNSHRELFGNYPGEVFPLLIKIIDAREDLSIQVHPDDEYARIHEDGSLGKTECWYILDCDEDASLIVGHRAKDAKELKEMILSQRWDEFIREVPVKKGDFFQIEPGCLHAIKGGNLVFETQQNSDITYRVYDFDRLLNGSKRELHVQQSLDTIKAPFHEVEHTIEVTESQGIKKTHYITCPFYSVDKYEIHDEGILRFSGPFTNVTVIEGEGSVNGHAVKKGDSFIVPWQFGDLNILGTMSLICSEPPAIPGEEK